MGCPELYRLCSVLQMHGNYRLFVARAIDKSVKMKPCHFWTPRVRGTFPHCSIFCLLALTEAMLAV